MSIFTSTYKSLTFLILASFCFANVYAESSIPMRPDFTLPDVEGNDRSITEWDGKIMMVNFWATWCAPCVREIPMINDYHNKYSDNGFEVLGVAIDEPEKVAKYMMKTTMDYTSLVEEELGQEVAVEYSPDFLGLPFTAFVDHEGRILWTKSAEVHENEIDAILERMWKVRDGSLTAEQAQIEIVAEMKVLAEVNAAKKAQEKASH